MSTNLVSRAERQHYLNTGTKEKPVWSLIGEGFTSFTESKNAVSFQRRYIHERVKRTDVTGYAPTVEYEFEVYSSNPTVARLRRIADEEKIGEDAWVEICTVDYFDETSVSGVYHASRRTYSVIPDEVGDGTDTLVYTGTMKALDSPVAGEWVESTKVFTAL